MKNDQIILEFTLPFENGSITIYEKVDRALNMQKEEFYYSSGPVRYRLNGKLPEKLDLKSIIFKNGKRLSVGYVIVRKFP